MPQDSNSFVITAYPDPVIDCITVVCSAESNSIGKLTIRDAEDRQVYTGQDMPGFNDKYRFVYDASDLASGTYYYTVSSTEVARSGKFVKQ